MKLTRAILFVKDLRTMAAFYRDVLGLTPVLGQGASGEGPGLHHSEDWFEFDCGGATLALHAMPEHVAKQIIIEAPPRERSGTPVKLVFCVDDVDVARARLVQAGVVMYQRYAFDDVVLCDGLDPEGNRFQLANH